MVAKPANTAPVPLVLASGSPRRQALLAMAGFDFVVVVPAVDEDSVDGELPADMVLRLARAKGRAVAAGLDDPETVEPVVVAADTAVVIDDRILGKPADVDEAVEMLLTLAGRTHLVITGFVLLSGDEELAGGTVRSRVTMHPVDEAEARAYAATGEPSDKAGAYAAQGDGARFVAAIDGSRSNVVGLPLGTIVPLLEAAGVRRARC